MAISIQLRYERCLEQHRLRCALSDLCGNGRGELLVAFDVDFCRAHPRVSQRQGSRILKS